MAADETRRRGPGDGETDLSRRLVADMASDYRQLLVMTVLWFSYIAVLFSALGLVLSLVQGPATWAGIAVYSLVMAVHYFLVLIFLLSVGVFVLIYVAHCVAHILPEV